jgi:hypothetical protein
MTSPSSNIICIKRARGSYQGSAKFLENGIMGKFDSLRRPLYGKLPISRLFRNLNDFNLYLCRNHMPVPESGSPTDMYKL